MAEFNEYVEIGEPAQLAPALDEGMIKIAEKHDNIIAVLEDLGYPAISWFQQNAPHRILETGIAEGNVHRFTIGAEISLKISHGEGVVRFMKCGHLGKHFTTGCP